MKCLTVQGLAVDINPDATRMTKKLANFAEVREILNKFLEQKFGSHGCWCHKRIGKFGWKSWCLTLQSSKNFFTPKIFKPYVPTSTEEHEKALALIEAKHL